jgi:CRP-like cAMP-binding protein
MPLPDLPNDNHLLAALPAEEFRRLAPHLERFQVQLGETLHRPGEPLQYAYFPTSAIISLLYVIESGASAEMASVGKEGVLGIQIFMGGNTTHSSAVVQTAGCGYRLKARWLQEESRRRDAAVVAALYPGVSRTFWPNGRLQSASYDRAATVPLAIVDTRSPALERGRHDA